ncbi:hypothetical protein [Desulfosporosinus lacus]|uniref:Uncharacterized protein n=1 Tax=Desulfosporosinus lacus DSM 15449 TaxID=1121420 RepID=A0A1M5YR97_9FIRM|nr:hypothetical protein [Desulfosporosinus lacus]SHI14586.1 hypothetical protein SAMN02746098_02681 [Desulfosporosinus lacus DSM 15449]
MKKYIMLLFTLVVMIATVITQISEYKTHPKPEFREPFLDIKSTKFGQIKNIVWLDNFVLSENAVLVLATNHKNNIDYSSLSYLDIANGESKLLAEFPSHQFLDNIILFDNRLSQNNGIITAFNEGVVKITLNRDDNHILFSEQEFLPIEGFEEASSIDLKGDLYYSKPNDHLLYVKHFDQPSFSFFMNDNEVVKDMTYLRKPYQIVNANILDRKLTYTSLTANGIDLYAMDFDGTPMANFNRPIMKNVINAQGIEDSFGFIGMNLSKDSSVSSVEQPLNVFMARRYKANYDRILVLDTIPFNTDPLGSAPALDSTTFNDDYSVVYTSYDESHKGKLTICNYQQEPKVILEDENLFGPVSIDRKSILDPTDPLVKSDIKNAYILYFTLENDKVRVNICDQNGKPVKDITNIIMN